MLMEWIGIDMLMLALIYSGISASALDAAP